MANHDVGRNSAKQPLTMETGIFKIGYDDISICIKCGYGKSLHVGHPYSSCSEKSNVSSKMMTTDICLMCHALRLHPILKSLPIAIAPLPIDTKISQHNILHDIIGSMQPY
eukprot:15094745-Ditylum_brightwellii.AAC.1